MEWMFGPAVVLAFAVFSFAMAAGSARQTDAEARRLNAKARLQEAENARLQARVME